ncbi:MAG TPA: sugar ABC transporter permease [Microlunatus sp.]
MTVPNQVVDAAPVDRSVRGAGKEPWIPRTAMQKHRFRWGLIFTTPAIIGLIFLTAYPVIASLINSFTSRPLVGNTGQFVGLDNYRELFADPRWWQSLGNTIYLTFIGVPLGIVVALVLAILLNMKVRGLTIYRTIFFIPSIVPIVAAATIWLFVLNPQFGILNNLLSAVGISGPGWLEDPNWSKPALLLFGIWGVGNLMIILLAGLQGVPTELQEQAQIDGANWWAQFRNVTVPFISPHLLFALITGLIAGFQYFTQAYVLTGGNGDPAGSTLVSGVYLYAQAFYNYRLGYASAIGWVLFIIIAIISLAAFRTAGRRVYYGGQ